MRKLIFITILFSLNSFAHEGHDHGPGSFQPPKGGVVRSLETVHLELVSKGDSLQIYAYETNLKPASVAKYPVALSIALPKKKAESIKLEDKGDHWEASFDAKGAHRFTMELAIKQGGHDDKVKWVVEPKKR
jgi:hypothetical protein